MKNKRRKMRPQPPQYYHYDTDGCWPCKNRNGCAGCKHLKHYIAEDTGNRNNRKRKRDEKRFFDNY